MGDVSRGIGTNGLHLHWSWERVSGDGQTEFCVQWNLLNRVTIRTEEIVLISDEPSLRTYTYICARGTRCVLVLSFRVVRQQRTSSNWCPD